MSKRLRDIGEAGLIERIKGRFLPGPAVVKGIGDDCAVIRYTKDRYLLFTTDMIIEGVHFRKTDAPASIGHKSLAVNISDIAACGGLPRQAVVSLGLPAECSCSYINSIYTGIKRLADRFKIDIAGGDTNRSGRIVVSTAMIGHVKKRDLTLRSGAADKDIICLSGPLSERPDHLNFRPHLKEAQYIVRNLKPTSMIDISDGFFTDLNHILRESKKSAIIYESLIPCLKKSVCAARILDRGEQFKLIFTIPRARAGALRGDFYPVGEIMDNRDGIIYVTRYGKRQRISPGGYSHF
jgi:thiamine-monophosphate kinase